MIKVFLSAKGFQGYGQAILSLRILKKNKIKALKLKIIKNDPIHPEMHKNIFCGIHVI